LFFNIYILLSGLAFWCLTPLSTTFQLLVEEPRVHEEDHRLWGRRWQLYHIML